MPSALEQLNEVLDEFRKPEHRLLTENQIRWLEAQHRGITELALDTLDKADHDADDGKVAVLDIRGVMQMILKADEITQMLSLAHAADRASTAGSDAFDTYAE